MSSPPKLALGKVTRASEDGSSSYGSVHQMAVLMTEVLEKKPVGLCPG